MKKLITLVVLFFSIMVICLFSQNIVKQEEMSRELDDVNKIQLLKEQFENLYTNEDFSNIMEEKLNETSSYGVYLGYNPVIHQVIKFKNNDLVEEVPIDIEFVSLTGRSWNNQMIIFFNEDKKVEVGLYTNKGQAIKCKHIDDIYVR